MRKAHFMSSSQQLAIVNSSIIFFLVSLFSRSANRFREAKNFPKLESVLRKIQSLTLTSKYFLSTFSLNTIWCKAAKNKAQITSPGSYGTKFTKHFLLFSYSLFQSLMMCFNSLLLKYMYIYSKIVSFSRLSCTACYYSKRIFKNTI